MRLVGTTSVTHLHVIFDGDEGGEKGMDALCRLQPLETITVTGGMARKGNPTVDDIRADVDLSLIRNFDAGELLVRESRK